MICKKCNTEGVKNQAMGKEFYYCRNCKEEIMLEEVIPYDFTAVDNPNFVLSQEEIDKLFDAFVASSTHGA